MVSWLYKITFPDGRYFNVCYTTQRQQQRLLNFCTKNNIKIELIVSGIHDEITFWKMMNVEYATK